ncbi:peptidyl-prolyl cis-trans isomerase [Phenylobacterium sp.]|uniref:peptidyl-prolyl cis-trans isomerase n=1 Tax=Phenylobacterium sp. TaxID=1871053 RepID=UPI0025ECA6FF|nr:peptidyl-prolyl cis-trans isomerase [Phenylobacterium sp.]MBX3482159.1 peptidyl-prolyl cis-trans isomerase [Phenylobacterium sp.]
MHVTKAAVAAGLAVLIAAGCNKIGAAPSGPVAATVNGEAITVSQLDAELKASETPNATDPKVRNAALQRIVARKLLAQSAREQKLTDAPGAALLKAAAVETWEASLAQARAVAGPDPTPEEAKAYMAAHPELFAGRTAYLVDQLVLPGQPPEAVARALEPANTLEAVEAVLKQYNSPYRRGTAELDSLSAPPELVRKVAGLAPGELFVLPARQGLTINRVRASKVQPVTGDAAVGLAQGMLRDRRRGQALDTLVKRLDGAAKVTYGEGFAAPK